MRYSQSFMGKAYSEKLEIVSFRLKHFCNHTFRWIPRLVRLPSGVWWLAYNDAVSDEILVGNYEREGYQFTQQFLQAGMIVLDIGAHYGFYTVLASKKVGPGGRVIAFEPSLRERKRLLRHLRLNGCKNVQVEGLAVANCESEAEFFVVQGRDTGCNSLRPPMVNEKIGVTRTSLISLDKYLQRNKINHLDFIKIDAEGAELEILKGASELLQRKPRPVIYCEVYDSRTQPWGYRAKEIILYLLEHGYCWFRPLLENKLEPLLTDRESFAGNFVAVPQERIEQISKFLKRAD